MLNLPDSLLTELQESENILLVGAGGGFDVLATLPLYYSLVSQYDIKLHIANYSFVHFTALKELNNTVDFEPKIQGATSAMLASTNHFPEGYLSLFFKEGFAQENTIWMFDRHQTIGELKGSYERFIKQLGIDTVIVCGYGTRGLMRGNEERSGDMLHSTINMGALSGVQGVKKYFMTIGHELNSPKPVSFNSTMENISLITKQGGYLGGLMLDPLMTSYSFMKSAFEFIVQQDNHENSEIVETVIVGTEGGYGPYENGTTVCALMNQCHFFDLNVVMAFNQVFPMVEKIDDYSQLVQEGLSLIKNSNNRPFAPLQI
jgi:hypothetical protein